jgi:hypothetical protein
MKKLIIILAVLVMSLSAMAQAGTFTIAKGNTISTVTTDYTLSNTTESYFVFKINSDNPITIDYQVLLTKGTLNHTATTVVLYGRKFSGDAWVQVGSTSLSGAIVTTATVSIPVLSPVRYREFKASLTGTGTGTTTISEQRFKFWNE